MQELESIIIEPKYKERVEAFLNRLKYGDAVFVKNQHPAVFKETYKDEEYEDFRRNRAVFYQQSFGLDILVRDIPLGIISLSSNRLVFEMSAFEKRRVLRPADNNDEYNIMRNYLKAHHIWQE